MHSLNSVLCATFLYATGKADYCCQVNGTNLTRSVHQLNSYVNTHMHAHTHTHPFNSPFSGTTQVSRYQKGETNLDFT